MAVAVSDLGAFISLVGAVSSTTLALLLPPVMDLVTFWPDTGQGHVRIARVSQGDVNVTVVSQGHKCVANISQGHERVAWISQGYDVIAWIC